MKKTMIILCITVSLFTWLLVRAEQLPLEPRPPEIAKPSIDFQLKLEPKPPEALIKPVKDESIKLQQPIEPKPPEAPKPQPPKLTPACKDDEILKDGKCVKK